MAASASASPSPGPSSVVGPLPANRHAPTAVEMQRLQLARLLKDPAKPAHIPAPPKEKTIRPPREMMKNVQGSSAGAGSGEFHVYKSSRRREYERLKVMDETAQKEIAEHEFEQKKRQWEEEAESKTAKNRAKRQKKKEKAKTKGGAQDGSPSAGNADAEAQSTRNAGGALLKKRRLVNGAEIVFRKPGEEGEEIGDDADANESGPFPLDSTTELEGTAGDQPQAVVETSTITIIEDD
ncbi:hypothetical protein M0805_008876 [Coniferiporia weirii]|nr:hypothetical protein M0805_008876 [Coniferiporia weirii]